MYKFKDLDTVILIKDIKKYGLRKGDMGAVVQVYDNGKAGEVEFVTAIGRTVALVTLTLSDVRQSRQNDLLHVRGFATA